ncbi:MAG: hypothetical protein IJ733_20355, partial [Lachnospiraceae bacterium]|nr:hypothetical protein [Lachnospiraceae bacterium]
KKQKINGGKQYKVTFDIQFDLPASFKKSEIDLMAREGGGSWYYITAVDYQTKEVLEYNNKYGVKVTQGKWKDSGLKKYYGTCGNWYRDYKTAKTNVTITYPKEYKDLCILAGGCADRFGAGESIDWQGWKKYFRSKNATLASGIMTGWKSSQKSVCHGMRVK